MTSAKSLRINDLFWTFQGEGLHAGRRALFVRMPYCNLACSWCDTEFNSFKEISISDLGLVAMQESAHFAVITGGEPMLNKDTPRVVKILQACGFEIACETNGTAPIVDGIDFVTVSPKRFTAGRRTPGSSSKMEPYMICSDAEEKADEFKYVVDWKFDFAVLDRHDTTDGRRYSLSPEFNGLQENLARIFDYVARNPRWRISLQTHKWMGVK